MFNDLFFKGPFDHTSELDHKRGPLNGTNRHVNAFSAASAPSEQGAETRMMPAHRAAWRGCPMELVELAEEGEDMLCRDEAGNTAVHWAAIGQKADNLKHLLGQGHGAWELNDKKQDALSIALEFKDYPTAKAVLDHAGLGGRSPDAQTPPEYDGAKTGEDILRMLKEQIALDKAAKLKRLARLQH